MPRGPKRKSGTPTNSSKEASSKRSEKAPKKAEKQTPSEDVSERLVLAPHSKVDWNQVRVADRMFSVKTCQTVFRILISWRSSRLLQNSKSTQTNRILSRKRRYSKRIKGFSWRSCWTLCRKSGKRSPLFCMYSFFGTYSVNFGVLSRYFAAWHFFWESVFWLLLVGFLWGCQSSVPCFLEDLFVADFCGWLCWLICGYCISREIDLPIASP